MKNFEDSTKKFSNSKNLKDSKNSKKEKRNRREAFELNTKEQENFDEKFKKFLIETE